MQLIGVEFFGGPKDGMLLMIEDTVKERVFKESNTNTGAVIYHVYVIDKDDDGIPCMKYKGTQ